MIWVLVYENRMKTYENRCLKTVASDKEILFLDPNYVEVFIGEEVKFFYKGQILKMCDKVWSKLGCMINDHTKDLLNTFKILDIKLVNDNFYLDVVANKFSTNLYLRKEGIKYIHSLKTLGYNENVKSLNEIVNFPLIIKSKVGSLGKGIYKIQNLQELENIREQINLLDKSYEYLVQEYVKEGNVTYRVVVFGGEIVSVVQNKAKDGDFKSNFNQGGISVILEEFDKEIVDISQKVFNAIKLNIMGIDLIKLEDGSYIVCEINSNPGFEFINRQGFEMEKKILKYVKEL